jgi:3-deoxy-7-phosphoheptulonate synthase
MLIRVEAEGGSEEGVWSDLVAAGCQVRRGGGGRIVVVGGAERAAAVVAGRPGVAAERLAVPFKQVARAARPEGTRVRVGEVEIGGAEFVVAAGPCSVETEVQMEAAAAGVAAGGARLLRAGAFKPRTSPYSFQGLGDEGLHLLAAAGRRHGLPTVTEVLTPEDVPRVAAHADLLQVGARNAQNFELLKALGRVDRPVLLKRGPSSTVEELALAAEYVVEHGNPNVILCERGIRTFETATRNTLDLNAVAWLKAHTHLPVVVDPSHGTGVRDLVAPLAKAAAAVGADGILIEVHPDPDRAWTDGAQSITPRALAALVDELAAHLALDGRTLGPGPRAERAADEAIGRQRGRIDSIDAALVRLLDERARVALAIGRVKSAFGRGVRVPAREEQVLRQVRAATADGPLGSGAAERLFLAILEEMRRLEHLGEPLEALEALEIGPPRRALGGASR